MAHREHLVGIDDRVFQSIRGVPDLKPALRLQAREHELHRLESVAEILGLMAIMVRQGLLTGHESVLAEAAIYQFGKGSREAAVQAAHCLPGQLKFDGQPFDDMPGWTPARLKDAGLKPIPLDGKLRNLSARTDYVDTLVNTSDSWLEKMPGRGGLKPVFAQIVQSMASRSELAAGAGWAAVRKVVSESIAAYRREAAMACQRRVAEIAGRNPPALLGQKPSNDQYKAAIILEYMKVLLSKSSDPDALGLSGFRGLMRDVLVEI